MIVNGDPDSDSILVSRSNGERALRTRLELVRKATEAF